MTDEHLQEITNYQQLQGVILDTFISGSIKDKLSSEEDEIIDRKCSWVNKSVI